MIIIHVARPIYSNAERSAIDCTVTFDDGNTYPYTAVPNDSTDYGVKLWNDLTAGSHGSISAFPGVPEATLRAALAAYRYEVSSVGVEVNGHTYDTDADSRTALTAAFMIATLNPAYTCTWKTASDEFVPLDAGGIVAVGTAVMAFVQKCFDTEAAVAAMIDQYKSVAQITAAFDAAMAA